MHLGGCRLALQGWVGCGGFEVGFSAMNELRHSAIDERTQGVRGLPGLPARWYYLGVPSSEVMW